MAKKRLIPKLLFFPSKLNPGKLSLVTTIEFSKIIETGDPVSQAKIYESQMVDELILIDLSHSKGLNKNDLNLELLNSIAKEVFIPLTVGGGVQSIEHFRLLLKNGADKIAINSAALSDCNIVYKASEKFGAQCVVACIDYKINSDNIASVYANSGTKKYNIDPISWAQKLEKYGAGEILLTCLNNDGKKSGLDLEISKSVISSISIPVILSGGCGRAKHFVEGFKFTGAEAIAAGTFFCFQDQNPMQTRSQITNGGIDIRLSI